MKNFFSVLLLSLSALPVNAEFINPSKFDGSEAQKKEVISYIQERVRIDYCEKNDMCQEVIIKMMERENLNSFKKLTKAKDVDVLNRAIYDYCDTVDMCSYQIIEMMYNQNLKAKNEKISW